MYTTPHSPPHQSIFYHDPEAPPPLLLLLLLLQPDEEDVLDDRRLLRITEDHEFVVDDDGVGSLHAELFVYHSVGGSAWPRTCCVKAPLSCSILAVASVGATSGATTTEDVSLLSPCLAPF